MAELQENGVVAENTNPQALSEEEFAALGAPGLVYVRTLSADDLISEIPEAQSEIDASGVYYALHGADGRRLAVLESHEEAVALAHANDARPVSLH